MKQGRILSRRGMDNRRWGWAPLHRPWRRWWLLFHGGHDFHAFGPHLRHRDHRTDLTWVEFVSIIAGGEPVDSGLIGKKLMHPLLQFHNLGQLSVARLMAMHCHKKIVGSMHILRLLSQPIDHRLEDRSRIYGKLVLYVESW